MNTKNVLIVISILVGIIFISSCKEEPPVGVVKVINENGEAVPDAEIRITANGGLVLPDKKSEVFIYTDASGQVEKTFETDAIYDLEVKEYDGNEVIREATGILKLEMDQTYTETVTVRPVD